MDYTAPKRSFIVVTMLAIALLVEQSTQLTLGGQRDGRKLIVQSNFGNNEDVCIKPFKGYACLEFSELEIDSTQMTTANSIDQNIAFLEGFIDVQIILPPITVTTMYSAQSLGFNWRRRLLFSSINRSPSVDKCATQFSIFKTIFNNSYGPLPDIKIFSSSLTDCKDFMKIIKQKLRPNNTGQIKRFFSDGKDLNVKVYDIYMHKSKLNLAYKKLDGKLYNVAMASNNTVRVNVFHEHIINTPGSPSNAIEVLRDLSSELR